MWTWTADIHIEITVARATSENALEKRIRRMTPVAAPASQRAAVESVSAFLVGIAHPPEGEPRGARDRDAPAVRAHELAARGRRLFEGVAEVLARGDSRS